MPRINSSPDYFNRIGPAFIHSLKENFVNIGFLGLGNMGEPIAANLISAGHQVTVWNRTASKADALTQKGAKLAKDVAAAARNEIVFPMLADDNSVRSVLTAGLAQSLPKSAVHISLSTISVSM